VHFSGGMEQPRKKKGKKAGSAPTLGGQTPQRKMNQKNQKAETESP